MEKLTGKQFEALEKQMRKAVNALRSGEQSTLPSSTGSLKTPNTTASNNASKTPSASSSRSINQSLMEAWQDGKKSSESSTSKSTSEEKLLSKGEEVNRNQHSSTATQSNTT